MGVGLVYVLLITLDDHEKYFWIDYLFTTCIGLYYYIESGRKINYKLIALYIFSCGVESLFIFGFTENYNGIMWFATLLFIVFLIMLYPVARETIVSFKEVDMLSSVLGIIGMGYILCYIIYVVLPVVPNKELLIMAVIPFGIVLLLLIFIPVFNTRINNFNLVIIGGALFVEMVSGLVSEFLFESYAMVVATYVASMIYKVVFAVFLLNRMKKDDRNLELDRVTR